MKNPLRNLLLFGLTLLLLAPTALAWNVPVVGEVDPGFNWVFIVFVLGILAFAGAIPATRKLVRGVPIIGSSLAGPTAVVMGIVLTLVAAFGAPGGLSFGDAAPAAAASDAVAFDATTYEATSDVTFYAANAATKAAVSPAVKIYKSGVTEKAAFEGSAVAEYSGTMSSGSLTISGIQTQTLGCTVDVALDLASYYEVIKRDINICVAKNVLGNNDIAVPTFYMEAYGTQSLSKTDTSLTCTAGTQCSYTLIVRNSAADTYLHNVAVNFTNVDSASLDSVDAGGECEIVEVSGTKYVKFTNDIGPLEIASCPLKITRATGDTDGSFYFFMDDLYQQYGATAWNTNSNVRGATVSSQATVSFA